MLRQFWCFCDIKSINAHWSQGDVFIELTELKLYYLDFGKQQFKMLQHNLTLL